MRDGGSPFYRQTRVGRGGASLHHVEAALDGSWAEAKLASHLDADPAARAECGHTTQKLKNDPRITPFGQFLRRSSLDELPQLWNVLKGDMSLVGPRPMMPDQAPLYPGEAYYALRPGITGLWQVSERNATAFAPTARITIRAMQGTCLGHRSADSGRNRPRRAAQHTDTEPAAARDHVVLTRR